MANYKVTDTELSGIASAIRLKGGTSEPLVFPSGFISAVEAIPSASSLVLVSKSISSNGTYDPSDDSADAYSQVVVDVPSGGGSGIPLELVTGGSFSLINSTVSNLRSNVCYQCVGLTEVSMDAVESIPSYAFYYCTNLESAFFENCKTVGYHAFRNDQKLSDISFPECISIMSNAFNECKRLVNASFPKCTYIGDSAFYSCNTLVTASFPSCSQISINAFGRCSSLQTLYFPIIEVVDSTAFMSCSMISEVDFPLCTKVSSSAFMYGYGIKKVLLPACNEIANYAFFGCSKMESLYLLASSVCALTGDAALKQTPMSTNTYLGYYGSIFVPSSLVNDYKAADRWSVYADRITAYVEE